MALPQLPAYVVHKLGQHPRVIQEFLSTREYAKESRPFRSALFRACGLSNIQGTFRRFLFKYFFFFQCSLALLAWGRNSCVRFAFFSMSRLPKHSCAVTAQHLLLQMHSISITPECYSGAFSRKSTFLKISLLFIFSLPSPILPRDEREKTERTPTQLSANKKCCLLIFAIAIGCLVLADFPASFPPFSFLSAVMLCGVPETLVAFWGALCGSTREKSLYPLKKIAPKAIFICIYAKIIVSLHNFKIEKYVFGIHI